MSQASFGRRYTISASHRLHTDALSAEQNRTVYGKCNNPHGHGHNYVLEVLVSGQVNPETGMVVDMVVLDHLVRARILDRFDHANLNLDPAFVNLVPTTENLCRAVFDLLAAPGASSCPDPLRPAKLERVRVEETENNFFEYAGN